MNSLLEDNDEDVQDHHRGRAGQKPDREITLGTTMVLGIFFALAVLVAVSVGFGYSLGVKHTESTVAAAESNPNATFGGFKAASGKTAGDLAQSPAATSVIVPLTTPPPVAPRPVPVRAATDSTSVPDETANNPALEAPVRLAPAAPIAPPTRPAAMSSAPVLAPAGAMMVQIAAVSHQEDADLLVSTLKRRSYAVAIHHEPQDQLLHVQVGPFATKQAADAMRLRLQADGFNAIVKSPAN